MARGGQTPEDPASPEMKAAWMLADAGDVREARRAASRILAQAPSEADRAQAEELLARTQAPRALYGFAVLAAAVLLVLLLLTFARS